MDRDFLTICVGMAIIGLFAGGMLRQRLAMIVILAVAAFLGLILLTFSASHAQVELLHPFKPATAHFISQVVLITMLGMVGAMVTTKEPN